MDQNLILAIIQGITEFLPVSSSAHLIAAAQFFGIQAPGQLLEVILHMGTVLVVLLAFHRSIWGMICGISGLLTGSISPGAHEFFKICWGSLPVIVAGYLHRGLFSNHSPDSRSQPPGQHSDRWPPLWLWADRYGQAVLYVIHSRRLGC